MRWALMQYRVLVPVSPVGILNNYMASFMNLSGLHELPRRHAAFPQETQAGKWGRGRSSGSMLKRGK